MELLIFNDHPRRQTSGSPLNEHTFLFHKIMLCKTGDRIKFKHEVYKFRVEMIEKFNNFLGSWLERSKCLQKAM
jgi:hypothetical protein